MTPCHRSATYRKCGASLALVRPPRAFHPAGNTHLPLAITLTSFLHVESCLKSCPSACSDMLPLLGCLRQLTPPARATLGSERWLRPLISSRKKAHRFRINDAHGSYCVALYSSRTLICDIYAVHLCLIGPARAGHHAPTKPARLHWLAKGTTARAMAVAGGARSDTCACAK